MNAKVFLSVLEEKKDFWERKKIELLQLKALETNTTAPLNSDPVQSSGNKDKLGSAVSKRIDFENEVVEKAKSDFYAYYDECIKVLEQVKEINYQHYKILHSRYIEYLSLKKVAQKEGYSYQYVKELHREGLKNVQKILDVAKLPTETY